MSTDPNSVASAQWYAEDLAVFKNKSYISLNRLATGFNTSHATLEAIRKDFLEAAIIPFHRTSVEQPYPVREQTASVIARLKAQYPLLCSAGVDTTWCDMALHRWIKSTMSRLERQEGGLRPRHAAAPRKVAVSKPTLGLGASDTPAPTSTTGTIDAPRSRAESMQQPSEAGSTSWTQPSMLTMVMHFERAAVASDEGEEIEADTTAFLLHHCDEGSDLHDLSAEAVLMSLKVGKLWDKLAKKLSFDPEDEDVAFWSDVGAVEGAQLMLVQDDEALEVAVAIAMHRGDKVVKFEIVAKEAVVKNELNEDLEINDSATAYQWVEEA